MFGCSRFRMTANVLQISEGGLMRLACFARFLLMCCYRLLRIINNKLNLKTMIQKTDLRIGNHLKYFIGEEGIDWDATKIDVQDLQWCEEKNENFNEVHKGIELTTTILVMSGFTEDNHNRFTVWKDLQTHYLEFIVMPDGFYPMYAQLPELSSEEEQRVALNRIKYVHELENLFFVLTGKELNVNLETVGSSCL
jgi:hypothetical protein